LINQLIYSETTDDIIKMPFNNNLCRDLIKPLQTNVKFTDDNPFGVDDDWRDHPENTIKYRYQYNAFLIDYLMSFNHENNDVFIYSNLRPFEVYVKHISKLPLQDNQDEVEIDEKMIRYAIINSITLEPYDGKMSYGEKFIRLILDDKVVDAHIIIEIAFDYIQYMKKYPIIEMMLPLCKLTAEQMDMFVRHYKNGDIYIIKHFMNWGLMPSEKQIHMLISNKNKFDEAFIKEFNVEINAGYVIANIKAGNHKIIGVNPKQKWKFTVDQKKELNICIFEHMFTKAQIESMRKLYDLTYDIDSLLSLCKHEASIPVFNYLVDLGIKPTVECLYYMIPKHCSHSRVHDILSKSVNAKVD